MSVNYELDRPDLYLPPLAQARAGPRPVDAQPEDVPGDGHVPGRLGVDTQNPNGALRLYESCGFEVEFCSVVYEKPVLDTKY